MKSSSKNIPNRLERLRKQIDQVDVTIIRAIGQRMELSHNIGLEKKRRGLGIVDPVREKQLWNLHERVAKKLNIDTSTVHKIFKLILKESRRIQGGRKPKNTNLKTRP